MRYEGRLFRPPSEAHSYILQATVGCSWNHCVYCDMYRDKQYRVRELSECLEDIARAGQIAGKRIDKLFVADGDALGMPMGHWRAILRASRGAFPALRQVSCYATANNVIEKTAEELAELFELGLTLLYMGPESGDDVTLKRIAKGATFDDHVAAAGRARSAGLALSVIFMLGIAGVERSTEHARASARLVTEMNPQYLAALTTTIVPGTPLVTLVERQRFELPTIQGMLRELRTLVDESEPGRALFRTNHASNYLALGGELPRDRARIVGAIDEALGGRLALRSEAARRL